MRLAALIAGSFLLAAAAACAQAPRKLTGEERIEIIRGLTAEHATVKGYLPRSKKALVIKSDGTWDKREWLDIGSEFGAVAKTGEDVTVTKVSLESDKIVLEINGGLRTRGKWYERIEAGGGVGGAGRTSPISGNRGISAGTALAIVYPGKLPPVTSAELKKLLAPLLDFEKRSVVENYFEKLPPEMQAAIKEKRAIVGMDREQVVMALGRPRDRMRETVDGKELEDWVYGLPPGKITFVTFHNGKVLQVKDSYAGLGGQTAPPLKPPQ